MTRIEAIIRPHGLDALLETLEALGLSGLAASEVRGLAGRAAAAPISRGVPRPGALEPRPTLEVVVPTPFLPRVLDAVARAARGGRLAGAIFASRVDEAVRIRTGEHGEGAL